MPIDSELLATVTGGARSPQKAAPSTSDAQTKQPSLGNVDVFHLSGVQRGPHIPTTPL